MNDKKSVLSICFYYLIIAFLLTLRTSNVAAQPYTIHDCIRCHTAESGQSRLRISLAAFNASVHAGNIDCLNCHADVTGDDHAFAGAEQVDCGQCHIQQNEHGITLAADAARPQCADCHSRHAIRAPSDPDAFIHPNQLQQTCGRCHPAQSGRPDFSSRLVSSRIAFHAKGDLAGAYSMRNCLGCHQGRGAHGETHSLNTATCHTCHMHSDGSGVLLGDMHPPQRLTDRPWLFSLAVIYYALISAMALLGLVWGIRLLAAATGKGDRP